MKMEAIKCLLASIALMALGACGGGDDRLAGAPMFGPADGKTSNPAPAPTPTPIGASDVLYRVEGSAKSASLTYQNQSGGTLQEVVTLPWEKSLKVAQGGFLYISAQNQDSAGSVVALILVNGKAFKESRSEGAYVIATASGSCC